MFRRAGAGIAAAHAAGVVHRDFKLANVLIDQHGRPRVLDFGLARQGADRAEDAGEAAHPQASSTFDAQRTRTGAVMGTRASMAPEQFAGDPSDERTDQFAFCVVLHDPLTGERTFCSYSYATLRAAVVRGKRTYAAGAESLEPAILAVLDRGLQTSPDARFESMTELLDALSPADRSSGGLIMVGVAVLATASAAAYGLGKKNTAPPAGRCLRRFVWRRGTMPAPERSIRTRKPSHLRRTVLRALAVADSCCTWSQGTWTRSEIGLGR